MVREMEGRSEGQVVELASIEGPAGHRRLSPFKGLTERLGFIKINLSPPF